MGLDYGKLKFPKGSGWADFLRNSSKGPGVNRGSTKASDDATTCRRRARKSVGTGASATARERDGTEKEVSAHCERASRTHSSGACAVGSSGRHAARVHLKISRQAQARVSEDWFWAAQQSVHGRGQSLYGRRQPLHGRRQPFPGRPGEISEKPAPDNRKGVLAAGRRAWSRKHRWFLIASCRE